MTKAWTASFLAVTAMESLNFKSLNNNPKPLKGLNGRAINKRSRIDAKVSPFGGDLEGAGDLGVILNL